jgi:hypothetical protein
LSLKSRRRRVIACRSRRLIRVGGRRKQNKAGVGRHLNPVGVRGRVRDKGRVRRGRGNSSNSVRRRAASLAKGRPPGRKMALTGKLRNAISVTAGRLPRCNTLLKRRAKKMPA